MRPTKPCHICGGPKAPGKGRRTCDKCQGTCHRCGSQLSDKQRCRECIRRRNLDRYQNEPGYAERKRVANKLSLYGITQEEYDSLEWTCAICGTTDGKLVIDHHHDSGKVRSVLCSYCNTALGMLKEDTERMRNMIKYVEEHQ